MNDKTHRISRLKGTVKPFGEQPPFLHLLALTMIMDKKSYLGNSAEVQLRMYLGKLDLHPQRGIEKGNYQGLKT